MYEAAHTFADILHSFAFVPQAFVLKVDRQARGDRIIYSPPTDFKTTGAFIMGKYVLGWMLGIPVVVLAIIYMIFN